MAEDPPATLPVSASAMALLVIAELGLCLGLQDGNESGAIHFEIWDDQVEDA